MSDALIIHRRSRSREYTWMSDPTMYFRSVTPAAVAGRRRSEKGKQQRHAKKWGMLAEVMPAPPPEPPIEERVRQFNAHAASRIRERRDANARDWQRARTRLRELPREDAVALLAEWNARSKEGNAWGIDLLVFLDERAPTPERIAELREARLASAVRHRRSAERTETYWIEHVTCVEAGFGVVEVQRMPIRRLKCIACEREWGKTDLERIEAEGIMRIVDCRRAVQEELKLC